MRATAFLIAGLMCLTLFAARDSANASHQFLQWDEDGTTFKVFGANENVSISLGAIEYVADCNDEGLDDVFFPISDIYVLHAGMATSGFTLVDVVGTPNTVTGTGGGLIADETIAFTYPGGTLPAGLYDVVYDECQNAKVDADDAVFEAAFLVDIPTDAQPLPSISAAKAHALANKDRWELTVGAYRILFKMADELAGDKLELANNINEIFGDAFGTVFGSAVDAKEGAEVAMIAQAQHWGAIAADPPDPNFVQLTTLSPIVPLASTSSDPAITQGIAVGTAAANSDAVSEALLHALERYQGADAATDGEWALVHAREIKRFAELLSRTLSRQNDELSAMSAVLTSDARDFNAQRDTWEAFRLDVQTNGLSAAHQRELLNAGATPAMSAQIEAAITALDMSSFSEASFLANNDALRTTNTSLTTELLQLSTDMGPLITALEANPTVPQDHPIASAGGPYSGTQGSLVPLDASASTSLSSIVQYAWDMDADGQFDDTAGAAPTASFDRPGTHVVGVLVTNNAGQQDVAYALVDVSAQNAAPVLSNPAPDAPSASLTLGESQTFAIGVTDPDIDNVTLEWLFNGTPVGNGATFNYTAVAGDTGVNGLEVVATDDSGLNGQTRYDWLVIVNFPDGDGDLWNANVDCEDGDASVHPGQPEVILNGKDDDCNPATADDGSPPNVDAGAIALWPDTQPVPFNPVITHANDAETYKCSWDFGDGSLFGTECHTSHQFADVPAGQPPVQYTATLTVTDDDGGVRADTYTFAVGNADVLILRSTVVVDAYMSWEAQMTRDLGMIPEIVDDATWLSKSTPDFAEYRAIVLGDPNCPTSDPTTAAKVSPATWSDAVTGNVVVVGSDPSLHDKQELIRNLIEWAAAVPGNTGAYIATSCYGDVFGAENPVPYLKGFGDFFITVTHRFLGPCVNTAHIAYMHPILDGVTDGYLSGWNCSAHGLFNSYPSDWFPLAIVTDLGGSYTSPDGASGIPFILVRGDGFVPRYQFAIAQESVVGAAGILHTITATTDPSISGQPVNFTVTEGPNAGATGTSFVDPTGRATFSYTGTRQGVDQIRAKLTYTNGAEQLSNTVKFRWRVGIADFVVNSTRDIPDAEIDGWCNTGSAIADGQAECTVRAAIQESNGDPDLSIVHFAIPADGPHTITLGSSLPDVDETAVIDAATQPGSACPDGHQVKLTPATLGTLTGFHTFLPGDVTIRGFVITNFHTGIEATANTVIECNYVGLDFDGSTPSGNRVGILVDGWAAATIGGDAIEDRNVISTNTDEGILLREGYGIVQGNYIGTDATGMLDRGNGAQGVNLFDGGVTLGGNTATTGMSPGNVISGNNGTGVTIGRAGGTIQGNLIGSAADGVTPLGNNGDGVFVFFGGSALVGGTTVNAGNEIAFNGGNGFNATSCCFGGAINTSVLGNSIHDNGSRGINIGVNTNDPGDPDGGSNNGQNFPFIETVQPEAGSWEATGTLNSTPDTDFRLEFYANQACDPTGDGEGNIFLGHSDVQTDGSGDAPFLFDFAPQPGFEVITATATDPAGNTSQFSRCQSLAGAIVVNSTGDAADAGLDGRCNTGSLNISGDPECTLRAAIQEANFNPDDTTIAFDIPGAGPHTIVISTSYPALVTPMSIDASTQPGASCPDDHLIKLMPATAGSLSAFYVSLPGGNTIRGFVIANFGTGIEIHASAYLECNYVGLDFDGTTPAPNGAGITINGSASVVGGLTAAQRNVISGNTHEGVHAQGSSGSKVIGNYIGTDATGMFARGNSTGVNLFDAALELGGNTLVPGTGAGNVISGNSSQGTTVGRGYEVVRGNLIGVAADGVSPLGNGESGLLVFFGATALVGGTAPGDGNEIAFNNEHGFTTTTCCFAGAVNSSVIGNSIHDNGGHGIFHNHSVNDTGDDDGGSNNGQNFPELTLAASDGSQLSLVGDLNSLFDTVFRVEFFANDLCDTSGAGEGKRYLGATYVTTVGNDATISLTLPVVVLPGKMVTSTATDPLGNTSQFSECVTVVGMTSTPTNSPSPSPTPTDTPSPAPTDTPSPAPTDTPSPTPIDTPSPTPTDTPSPAPTDTQSPTPTPTDTPSPTPTDTQSPTPTPTDTLPLTVSPSPTPTDSPLPTAEPTPTPPATSIGETPSPSPTPSPTPAPTDTPKPTPVGQTQSPTPTPSPTPEPTDTLGPGEQRIWGDNDCSDDPPNPVDGLFALRFDAGLSTNTGECPAMGDVVEAGSASPYPWGDIDCSGAVSPVDSLKLLRFDAGLDVAQETGCPALGTEVTIVVRLTTLALNSAPESP